jgi:putative SOS response-associated peptidase YedK
VRLRVQVRSGLARLTGASLGMCNDFEQAIAYQAYVEAMQREAWDIPAHQGELDLAPKADVRVNDTAAVIVAEGARAELVPMRWSFPPPAGGRGGPVFNFRSEGRSFAGSRRCLAPVSAFFEFTTPADPKQKRKDKWRFTRADGGWMALAGIWRPAEGNQPAMFTLLTCAPGPDVAQVHDRQIIPLEPPDWRAWLALTKPEAELLRPTPRGVLKLEPATAA